MPGVRGAVGAGDASTNTNTSDYTAPRENVPQYVASHGQVSRNRLNADNAGGSRRCSCPTEGEGALLDQTHPIPATVLDPFGGSGTTAIVARKLGRRAILIELNAGYCQLASRRLSQQSLFAEPVA